VKVLFSADWHIKLGQKNVPREWQKDRYEMLFRILHEFEEQADIHILGGDIFDKLPNTQELALYFEFISGITIPTYIYDGNHEATKKGHTFLTDLASVTNKVNDKAHIINGICKIYDIDVIPYTHLKKFKPKDFSGDILCTHVRGEIPPHVSPEIDLSLLDRWNVVLAGDLHAYENSQRNIIYPGSPLAISFHRNKIKNGVIIFDTETKEHEWIDLQLPQLLRKTVTDSKDIIRTEYDHTIYEVQGNIKELSDIDTTKDIIDKKVVNKQKDSILDLHNKTIQEELIIYLKDILMISEYDTRNIVNTFNDYYKEHMVE
jgi:DNA repair exonuclease SbcCD nuclease subunit